MLEHGYEGLTHKQTARALGLSASTIHTHWYNIRGKLGVNDRGQALAAAVRHGWIGKHPEGSGLPIVIFTERPRALGLTDGQRLYLRAFDEMCQDRTEESVWAVEVVKDALFWEVEADGLIAPSPRPCAPLDAMFLRIARAIGGWRPVRNRSALFGDRSLVTDAPAGC